MSALHMETENVREAARRIDLVVAELYYKPSSLKKMATELQGAWEGGQAGRFAHDIRRQADLLHREVVNLQRLAEQVRREVDEWEQRDQSFIASSGSWLSTLAQTSKSIRGGAENLLHLLNGALALGVIALMKEGSNYGGQVIFRGSTSLKDAVGLSKHLTHIRAENLPAHMISHSKLGPFEYVMAGWDTMEKGAADWARYDAVSDKVAAIGIDTAFVAVKTFLCYKAGYIAVTATVGAVAAAGAPALLGAGAGILAWWGASTATDLLMDGIYSVAENSGVKDVPVHVVGSGLDAVGQGIQKTARAVDSTFQGIKGKFFRR